MVAISGNPSCTYTLSNQPLPATSTSSQSRPLPTYTEALDVSPRARIFCEILNSPTPEEIERKLSSLGIKPESEVVEEVLRLLHASPLTAVRFLKWAELCQAQPGRVWELMVDLLGSNGLFEEMWDAVRSMRDAGILSNNTFVLVFRSYCGAGRVEEAIMAFDMMEKYGLRPDVAIMNSLLREICQGNEGTKKAFEFFDGVKDKIMPDVDTYVVLMEGLEKEKNVSKAKTLFKEMVARVGWSMENIAVCDAFLIILFCGSGIEEVIEFIEDMKKKNCCPGLRFFSTAIQILQKKNDLDQTLKLWHIMIDNGVLPNVAMFNSMIGLYCNSNKIESALHYLDEMVLYGTFPNSITYNTIFKCLVKNKKVREASSFFTEMTKNECPPTPLNCAAAISLFFDGDDPEMAVEIWYYVVNNRILPFEESANMLLIGLCNLGRLTELKRFAEKMIDKNIHISEVTMAKIKQAFQKRGGKACDMYNSLSRKWKSSQ